MNLTDKQAKALDALRSGGTIADVASRLGMTRSFAGQLVMRLRNRGLVNCDYGRGSQPAQLALTERGLAEWKASLK